MSAAENNPPTWRFIGTGESDEFFDLVLLDDDHLIILTTQEREVRNAIRKRIEKGAPVARLRAELADRVFSYDEIPIGRIRRLEWAEGMDVFRVEFEVSPGGLTDVGGWLEESAVPQLLEALKRAGKRVDRRPDEVVTARSLILFVAPPISLFAAVLAWSNSISLPGVLAVAVSAFVAVAALLWYANRRPSVGHVAVFR